MADKVSDYAPKRKGPVPRSPLIARLFGWATFYKFLTLQSRVWGSVGCCTHCGRWRGAYLENSNTAYYWDGKGRDPNAPIRLCREHAAEHHAYWKSMWNDYNSGRL